MRVDCAGDEFLHLVAPANGDAAQFKMRAFFQRHLDLHSRKRACGEHFERLETPARTDMDA